MLGSSLPLGCRWRVLQATVLAGGRASECPAHTLTDWFLPPTPLYHTQASAFADEDEDESAFVNCRPLVPLVPAAGQQGGAAPAAQQQQGNGSGVSSTEGRHCGILYGNESLFVLLRLHQFVYERMHAARSCALQVGSVGCGLGGCVRAWFWGAVFAAGPPLLLLGGAEG